MNNGIVLSENKTAFFNILSTVIIAGINFFTIPIFTRMLNTDGYGIVNVYSAWVSIFVVLIGLKADGSIGSAKANLSDAEQDSYQCSVLILSTLVFAGILGLVLIFLHPLSLLLNMAPLLTICMVAQSFGTFVISFFSMRYIFAKQAQKNFIISVGICVATTLLSIFLILFIFVDSEAYLGRVLGLCLPNFFLGVGFLIGFIIKCRGAVDLKYWHFCLALTVPLIFHGLSQLILGQTGKVAVQYIYGDSFAGIYSIAVVIVTLLNAIYGALNNAFVPFMYDDLAGQTTEEIKQRHFKNYFVSFTLGTVAFALLAPEILKLMSPEPYWGAIMLLPLLVIGQYCIFLYSFPVNYEFYKMKTKSIAIGTVLAATLNIILVFWLTPLYGMIGAAFSTMVSYVSLFVFHFCIARFKLGDRNYPARYYLCGLLLVSIVCCACYPFCDYVVVRWCIAVCALVLVGLRIFRTRSIF